MWRVRPPKKLWSIFSKCYLLGFGKRMEKKEKRIALLQFHLFCLNLIKILFTNLIWQQKNLNLSNVKELTIFCYVLSCIQPLFIFVLWLWSIKKNESFRIIKVIRYQHWIVFSMFHSVYSPQFWAVGVGHFLSASKGDICSTFFRGVTKKEGSYFFQWGGEGRCTHIAFLLLVIPVSMLQKDFFKSLIFWVKS